MDDLDIPPMFTDTRAALEQYEETVRIYEGARHELVNETNRDEVIDEITTFVTRIVAG